jgi:mRNA degradation ribonuclease J1/J2
MPTRPQRERPITPEEAKDAKERLDRLIRETKGALLLSALHKDLIRIRQVFNRNTRDLRLTHAPNGAQS